MTLLQTSLATLALLALIAYGAGQFTTRTLTTQIEINAPPAAVWAVLSDMDGHAHWNPFITKMSGDLTPGGRLSVTITPPGNAPVTLQPTVLDATPDKRLRWIGRLGLPGIFDGTHSFDLSETDTGTTHLRHSETFRGMLVLPIMALIGKSTLAGFEAMNRALKAQVEG